MAYKNPEKKGCVANPNGRPKGKSRTTCIRQALENVFNDSVVLEETILNVLSTDPNEILKLLAKLAPQKIESQNKNENNLTVNFVEKKQDDEDININNKKQ